MFLFHGREPRKASLLAGAIMGFLGGIVIVALAEILPAEKGYEFVIYGARIIAILFCVFGAPLGYLAGGLIAGIFLFREREEQAAAEREEATP